jgi:succinoglycan biosynthesis transport protein ExoP
MEENEQLAKARQGKVGRWEGDSDQALYALDEQGHGFTWEQALRVLRTHKWLLGGVIAGLTMSVSLVAWQMRDVYQPIARLEIDPLDAGIKTLHEIENPSSQADLDYLDTQVQILQSDGLAMRAIRALQLDRNPEFSDKKDKANANPAGGVASQRNSRPVTELSSLREQLDLADPTASEATALQNFHKNLSVNPIRNSRLVEVSFASHDPALSQAVTNTLVSQFIDQNYRNRYVTTMEASGWLSEQLNDLRQRVSQSNQTVADYQKKYGLVESDERDAPLVQLMAEVSRQFSDAQADRIQAEAYVRMIDQGQPDGIPTIRNDLVYQNLLTRSGEVQTQLAQAQAVYGEENTNVKKLQSQAKELAAQVEGVRMQLIGKVRTSLAAAQAREQMMLDSRERLRMQMSDVSSHLVEYRMLKNEAVANAALYNTLEARLQEAGIYAGLRSGNIRVVDMAPKLHDATSPHRKLIIASGAMLSVLMALTIVFVWESLDNTVRIPEDIRNWIQLPALAVLPRIGVHGLSNGDASRPGSKSLELDLTDGRGIYPRVFWPQTQTAEAEAIRSLRAALLVSVTNSSSRVVLVSSANAGEGKTTVALNLATVLAQQAKTCLVEGDLRHPMIERALGLNPRVGLEEVLTGKVSLNDALVTPGNIPGLTILPAAAVARNSADLLASAGMVSVVSQLGQEFDYVVIDSPPVIPFSDARSLASLSDAVILVSRYGRTTRRAMCRASELLDDARLRVIGVVLNDMDFSSADYHYFNYGFSWEMRRHYGYPEKPPLSPGESDQGDSGPEKSRGAHA